MCRYPFIILLIYCSLQQCNLLAQSNDRYGQNIDSLRQVLRTDLPDSSRLASLYDISEGYYYYHEDSMDLAVAYAQECIDLADKTGNLRWKGGCYNQLAKSLSRLEKLEEALQAYQMGSDTYYELGDSTRGMMVYDNIGYALVDMGRYDEALAIKTKACAYLKEHSDSSTIAASVYGIGWIYLQKEEYEKALPYYKQAASYAPNWELLLGEAYGDMLNMFKALDEPDSVAYYYKKAAKALRTIPSSIMINHYNYGLAMDKFGKLDSALYYVEKAIASPGGDLKGEEYNLMKVTAASFHARLGNIGKADQLFQQGSPYLKNTLNLAHKETLYLVEHEIYEAKGEHKRSLEAYKKYVEVREEKKAEKVQRNFQEFEAKYETAKKNQEIAELSLKEERTALRLKNRNRWLFVLAFGLLALSFLLYRIYKQKSLISTQKQALTKALEEKNVLLKEIHHRVKNNLQVISSLLGLQSRYVKDDVAQEALNVGKSRVQSMSLLHQKLYTNKDLKSVNIKTYFEELISSLISTYKVKDKVTFETDVDDLELDIDTVVPVGLMTNELISNALKHAFTEQESGHFQLSFKAVGENLVMRVKDNGKGIPFTVIPEKTASLGLQLIKSFTEKLEGNLEIRNDDGTEFVLTFPNKK